MTKVINLKEELLNTNKILDQMIKELDELIEILIEEKRTYIKDKKELSRVLELYSSNKEI